MDDWYSLTIIIINLVAATSDLGCAFLWRHRPYAEKGWLLAAFVSCCIAIFNISKLEMF